MDNAMILATTVLEGNQYADANGVNRRNVVTPQAYGRVHGRRYDKLIVVGQPVLNPVQAMTIMPSFFGAPQKERIVQHLRELVQDD